MQSILLSVCVVSFNTADLTVDALRSVIEDIQSSKLLKKRSEVIVVDNKSSDDTAKQIRTLSEILSFPLTIIQNKDNLGFSKANNQAIAKSQGEYIWLLNSDTFVQPGTTEQLVQSFIGTPDQGTEALSTHTGELDRLGMVAASLIYPDGSYQFQGGSYPTLFTLAVHMLMLDDIPVFGRLLPSTQEDIPPTQYHRTDSQPLLQKGWVAGTAVMVRRDMLEEIGLLDEKIFMYAEDLELCVRATDHHWDIVIHPTAYVTHHKAASSSAKTAILGELHGYLYVWAKHKPLWQTAVAQFLIKLGCLIRIVIFGTMSYRQKVKTYKEVLAEI